MDLEKIAHRVAMSRGVVVLDENVSVLSPSLSKKNIHTINVPKGMDDANIVQAYLTRRIFITRNTKDFEDYISSYEIGVISLEGLKFIDPDSSQNNITTKLISKAITEHSLWSKNHGFIVRLNEDGTSTYKELVD